MPEYVTEKPRTVCVECRHHLQGDYHACGAQTGQRWSPVTGEHWVWHPHCADINDGNCPHFEAKE